MPGPKATKKAVPAKAAPKSQRYEYVDLNKVSLTSNEHHNVYGLVVDATFPYKINQERYVCSLKIVDPTLYVKNPSKATDSDFATVVIYGKRFEDLPIAQRVGDIIRLHRATLRMYQGKRQFNVSTQWQGSWALFSAEDSAFVPSSYCGKRATFESHERQILQTLRKWISSHLQSSDGLAKDQYAALSTAKKQKTDFDVVAKVLSVHEMDEYTNELKIADGSEAWYVLALKLKFPHVRAGQVIYIRSATCDETSTHKNVLALSHYSNILSFHQNYKLAAALTKSVSDDWKADQAELAKAVPAHAIVVSEVDKKHAGLAQTSLNDLFHNESSLSGNTHRVTLNVVKVEGDVKEMVRAYNKQTKKSSSAKGGKGDLIWQVSLLCKDASTAANSNKYRILVQSHEGLGANFFGKAANLYTDAAAFKRTEKQVAALTKFNTFVDAVVEKRNNMWLIKDTKLRC